MSITVQVGLLSGKTTTVQARFDEDVETLKGRAQTTLGVGRWRLLDSSGSILDESTLVKDSSLQNGDVLTLHIHRVRVCSTAFAFAAIPGDGSVVPVLVVLVVLCRIS